jgi:hypothetical protein
MHDRRLNYLATVDIRSIRALEIRNDKSLISIEKTSVVFRDVALCKQQIIALNSAEADLPLVERLFAFGPASFTDDNAKHGSLSRCLSNVRACPS